ncbi:GNAT family N-acetyltransferase [Bacillus horti]|nr:GNAT family N-acetyltransferase [Bacillus horti]
MLELQELIQEDESTLFQLYVASRKGEFANLGWSECEIENLLQVQYTAQQNSYQQLFPQAKMDMVKHKNIPIGRMITNTTQHALHLVDIFIIPEYRGKEFGTALLRILQDRASKRALPIQLQVLMGNPAQRLYERCGFYVTAEQAPSLTMQWEDRQTTR